MASSVLLLVGALLGALGAWVQHDSKGRAQAEVRENLRPAQVATESLIKSYGEQEAALRGFLLTGDAAILHPFGPESSDTEHLITGLEDHLQGRPAALAALGAVEETAQRWLDDVARPQITARSLGPLPQQRIDAFVDRGHRVFDELRTRVALLSDEVARLISDALDQYDAEQQLAGTLIWSAFACALGGMAALGLVLWGMGSRPLRRLVTDVETVSAGDVHHPISAHGVQEYAKIGRAAGAMRDSLVARSRELAELRGQMAVLDEQQRLASDLHDLTIQRVFALGLSISALTEHLTPAGLAVVVRLVDETDAIISELRRVIYGLQQGRPSSTLRASLEDAVRTSGDLLGHRPRLTITGLVEDVPPDVAIDVTAVVREALSNVVKHARASTSTVEVTVEDGEVEVVVEDDGVGIDPGAAAGSGTWSRKFRAERHAGDVELSSDDGGTRMRWRATWPLGSPADPVNA